MSTLFIKDPKDYGTSFLLKGGENHGALQVGNDTAVAGQYHLYKGDLESMKMQVGFRIKYEPPDAGLPKYWSEENRQPKIYISFHRCFKPETDILTDWLVDGPGHTLSICRKEEGIFRELICLGKFLTVSLDTKIFYGTKGEGSSIFRRADLAQATFKLISAGGPHPSFSDISDRLKPAFQ